MSSSLRLEARVHHRHSISPIYCYHSDRDILNCHKTFTIDNMFIPFWTKLFQRCTNQQFWNKYLYKVTGRIETLVSLRITHINGNINTNVKKICSKQVILILNRFFTFVFMFPSMFVIRKLAINYQVIRYP